MSHEAYTPALDVLLGRTDLGHLLDGPHGLPYLCVDTHRCPFAEGDTESPWDPSESYFHCALLNEKVWGEDPQCQKPEWQERASLELSLLTNAGPVLE